MMEMILVSMVIATAGIWVAVRTLRKFFCGLKGKGGCAGCGDGCPLGSFAKKQQADTSLTVDGRDV